MSLLGHMALAPQSARLVLPSRSSLASESLSVPPDCSTAASVPSVRFVLTSLSLFMMYLMTHLTRTAPPPPKTITKEWEEASNERAKELKINPITGS